MGSIARPAGAAGGGEGVGVQEFHGFSIDDGDFALVFEGDVKLAGVVAGTLFGLAAKICGAEHAAVLGVDEGDVGFLVAEDHDALGEGVEEDSIRAAAGGDVDGFEGFERIGVPHDDRIAAAEAVFGLDIDGCAVDVVRAGNGADGLEGIEVVNINAAGAGNIQPAVGGIGEDIIRTACAADRDFFQKFVGAGGRRRRGGGLLGEGGDGEGANGGGENGGDGTHGVSLRKRARKKGGQGKNERQPRMLRADVTKGLMKD